MKTIKFIVTILLAFYSTVALAAPSVTGVGGTWAHGNSVTITGSSFGTKVPAKPLIWDDCEDASDGDYVSTSTHPDNTDGRVKYSDIEPPATLSATHRMRYRSIPYAPYGESGSLGNVTAPHQHSTKLVSYGHEDGIGGDGNDGANGWLTIPNTNGNGNYASDWFIFYYHRLNSEWPACGSSTNNKFFVLNETTDVWGGNNYHYWDYNKRLPCSSEDYVRITPQTSTATPDTDPTPPSSLPDTQYVWGKRQTITANIYTPQPQDDWQKYEIRISDNDGFIHFLVDNYDSYWGINGTDWASDDTNIDGICSVSIGGYYRRTSSPNLEHDDAHKIFDDIYVDDTLSHVILGNSSTYSSCTILEIQPPTAWSATSITVSLNQGKINDDSTAYLYVFDADGVPNATGYPVVIGSSGDDPPVVTITSPTSNPTYETASLSINISGTASDDSGLASISWTNNRGGGGFCTNDDTWTAWSKTGIELWEGVNVLTVTATDDAENTGDDILTVTCTTATPPTITGTSGTWTHGNNVTITGSSFGPKSPAPPLVWDDCTNNPALSTYYSDWEPTEAAGGSTYNMAYRSLPYRNVDSPDGRATYALAGAHAETDSTLTYHQGGTVGLGIDNTSHNYYINYWYRIDPLFDEENGVGTDNMKEITLSPTAGDFYDGIFGFTDWCNDDVPDINQTSSCRLQRTPYDCPELPYRCSGNYQVYHNNPINGWIKMQWEGRWSSTESVPTWMLTTYPDGVKTYRSHYNTPVTTYYYVAEDCGSPTSMQLTGIGGFARVPRYNLGTNSFRYFSRVYFDNTLSRVMIGDNQTYTDCTKLEPQPPVTWVESSPDTIIITLNQGILSTGTAYIFIFDNNGDVNLTGYEITIGEGELPSVSFDGGCIITVDGSQTLTIQ